MNARSAVLKSGLASTSPLDIVYASYLTQSIRAGKVFEANQAQVVTVALFNMQRISLVTWKVLAASLAEMKVFV
jgi:hypothetical protein